MFQVSVLTLLAAAAAGGGSGATTPTRDLIELSYVVRDNPQLPWPRLRVLSFTHMAEADRARLKKDVRFFVETVNRATRRAMIHELNDTLWAVDTRSTRWKAGDWDALARKWAYYAEPAKAPSDYLESQLDTEFPIMRADVFVREVWQPEWYVKFLNLPTTRSELFEQHGLGDDWPKRSILGVVPESDVQQNPRKVAYLIGHKKAAADEPAQPRDIFVTMNYEDTRGKNDSLRHPTNVDCNYNEIAVEMPNGLDFYFANAGGGADVSDDDLLGFGNSDSKMGGLVKQIPLRAGADHVHGGQLLLGLSCVSCHTGGAQPLVDKLASLSRLRFGEETFATDLTFDSPQLVARARQAATRWQAALRQINGRTPAENEAAWKQTFAAFDADVDLARAAAEVGVARPELLARRIRQWLEDSSDLLVAKLLDGPVTRTEFEQIFPTLRRLFEREDGRAVRLHFAGTAAL